MSREVQPATLVFLRKDDEILLAMKKRGFGEGLWNGVGGKVDDGESYKQAAIRETEEEIGVTPVKLNQTFELFFDYSNGPSEKDFLVKVFTSYEWEGEPAESEEMRPQWFTLDSIPYDKMWDDDRFWLPKLLAGRILKATVIFDAKSQVADYSESELTPED